MIQYCTSLNLITEPITEPVELEYTKNWLKIDSNITTDNELITNIIKLARIYTQKYTKRALYTQIWELVYDYQPDIVNFPLGMLQSVTSVKVIQEDGTESLQDPSIYHISGIGTDSGKLWLKNNSVWSTSERLYDNFKIRFTCGWDNVDNIPQLYKIAILKIVAYMYFNREYTDSDVYLLLQQTGVGRLY